jgi:hypothetical protein
MQRNRDRDNREPSDLAVPFPIRRERLNQDITSLKQ